jgi:hypothetical protein
MENRTFWTSDGEHDIEYMATVVSFLCSSFFPARILFTRLYS